jgi:hypothetical protein
MDDARDEAEMWPAMEDAGRSDGAVDGDGDLLLVRLVLAEQFDD